jgi:transcriptional regulator with XRE-family HTH domain
MKFAEKLARLTAEKNKQKVAIDAGLPPTAISNYITKNNVPRADTALALARALDVQLDWLVDDNRDWPPPPPLSASALSTAQLAEELSRRSTGIVDAIWQKLRDARGADWVSVASGILAADPNVPMPPTIQKQLEIPSQLNALRRELEGFVPLIPDMGTHALIRNPSAMDLNRGYRREPTLLSLFDAIETLESRPGFVQVFKLSNISAVPEKWRSGSFDKTAEETRREVEAELAPLRAGAAARKRPDT